MSGKKRKSRRAQHYVSVATAGEYGNTSRTALPHGYGGKDGLKSLASGIMEAHDNEENKLFNTKHEINKLVEGLFKSKEIEDEA